MSDTSLKILHGMDNVSPFGGGSQWSVLRWLDGLQKTKDVEVMVVTNRTKTSVPVSKDRHITLPTIPFSMFRPPLYVSWRLLPKVRKSIIDFKPNLLHLHDPMYLSQTFIDLATELKIPIISSYHTQFNWLSKNLKFPQSFLMGLVAHQQEKILRRSNHIIVPTQFWKKQLTQTYDSHISVVPYSIDDIFFQPKKTPLSDKVKLITISRLTPEKHIDLLIRTMPLLDARFTLSIIGEGTEFSTLTKLAQTLGVTDRVSFLGWLNPEQQVKEYHRHHVFLSASTFETFGLTYIEALATETPCIVADFAVSREVIPSTMARFVDSNDPEVWARQIESATRKKPYSIFCDAISSSRIKIERYSEKNSLDILIKKYKSIVR